MYGLKLNKENFNKKIKFEISDEFFETYTFDRFENAKLQISLFSKGREFQAIIYLNSN